jgi:hypothetical protein
MENYQFYFGFERQEIINLISEGSVCAEIGVYKGDFANEILRKGPAKLHLIDPWKSIGDIPSRWHAAPQADMDYIKSSTVSRFSSNPVVEISEKFSADAVQDFEDGYFDFIYIDANHSYEHIKRDLNDWWPKVKSGGFVCGNAYQNNSYQVEVLDFGVVPAVDEFVNDNHSSIKDFRTEASQYIIEKQ